MISILKPGRVSIGKHQSHITDISSDVRRQITYNVGLYIDIRNTYGKYLNSNFMTTFAPTAIDKVYNVSLRLLIQQAAWGNLATFNLTFQAIKTASSFPWAEMAHLVSGTSRMGNH